MISDDQYRQELARTIGELEAWAGCVRDVAEVTTDAADGVWRISAAPRAAGGCGFELGIRADQKFDLALADEFYEDEPIAHLTLFVELARAIEAGRVLRRHYMSQLTGVETGVEVIVRLGNGEAWSRRRNLGRRSERDDHVLTHRDRHYLPYRPPVAGLKK